ncbi:hypothetical protein MBRA_54390 (plasmid) [Mycobacterium branderi]|uniref:Uncharacterized protein n=2 Tax=Mycobacterium branderi TaxID=43348 RepID=A0ABM7KVX9_9MYCO|nr:hypothetical protein MBRA_54390 [Mycobacterium branderi]
MRVGGAYTAPMAQVSGQPINVDAENVMHAAATVAGRLERAAQPGPTPVAATSGSPVDAAAQALATSVRTKIAAMSTQLAGKGPELQATAQAALSRLQAQDSENAAKIAEVGARSQVSTINGDARRGIQAVDRTWKQAPDPQEPQPKDNPDPPWKDQPPPKNWEDIKKILDQLQKGENKPHRQLDTPEEIKDFWDWLSKGAKGDLPSPGFPRKVFDDGTEVGMRPDSKSGGPTVEFTPPDSKRLPKVHLPLPPPPAAPPAAAPPAAAPESPGPSVASQIGHDLESAGKGIWTVVVIAGGLLSGIFGGTGGRVPTP